MQTRRFGRTELNMPVFSAGGMRYQQSWSDKGQDIEPESQLNVEAVIGRSLELGINHIETARGYGTSERQLGIILPQLPRDELIVQTKIAPEPDTATFETNFAESLERLGLARVDLLGIHGVNTYEKYWHAVRPGGCLEAARKLQAQGLAGHVGVSTHAPLPLLQEIINTPAHGGFDYVNLHWYYIWQRNWAAIEAARNRDMGVFIISPADKGGRLYEPSDRLTALCEGLHPLVFNALFCLSRPEVHTLSLGAAVPSDFDSTVDVDNLLSTDWQDTVANIDQRMQWAMRDTTGVDRPEDLLGHLPPWEQAPAYMNLEIMVWLWAISKAWGLVEYGKTRYNMLGNGTDWFPGTNASALESFDIGRAIRKSPYADQIPRWLAEVHETLGGGEVRRLSQS